MNIRNLRFCATKLPLATRRSPSSNTRLLACLLAVTAGGYGGFSFGQDSTIAGDQPTLEEIIVTGSRMRGAVAPVGSAVVSLDREYIETSNAISVDEMIKEIPQVYDLGISEASRGQSGGNGNIVWANSVNLRGIGPYATLVLVDGHRVNSNARSIDPSILPSLALERVEVVADGSSAIYGSDAIAGVVNLITRRDVEGVEFIGRYGVGDEYSENKFGFSYGTVWDAGSFFLAYENGLRENLSSADRDFFRAEQPAADYRVPRCSPGTITADGQTYAIPEGGVTAANVGSLTPGTRNLCETFLQQDILPEQDYDNVAFTSRFDLTDSIELLVDGYWSNRDFVRHSAEDVGSLVVPNTNAFFVDPSGTSPASVTVDYSFVDDLPGDDQDGFQENWELTSTLRFNLPNDWRLEALVTYGDLHERSAATNGLDSRGPTSDLALALASSDPNTAFDPFGLHRTSPAVLEAISDQIFIADTSNELLAYEARADGDLFSIPGGAVQLAVGVERQEQTNEPGLQRGPPGAPNDVRRFERDVNSAYAELLFPIVGADNAVSGIQSLDLVIAGRYDDYSDVGSTTNPKFGINWNPIESLKLRASYGTSFRAPLFSQLYGNSSALFVQPYADPTQGGAIVQGVALSGGNLDLDPEEATTWSIGLDYQPEALPDLSISLTYFDIEYEGQIETYLADLSVLSLEEEFVGTGIILRDAEAEARYQSLLAQGFNVARGVPPTPVTLFVDGRTNNLGKSITQGIDFLMNYTWTTDNAGSFRANFGGMYMDNYDVSITPNGTLVDRLNTIFNPLKFKMRSSLTWDYEAFSTQLIWNHVNAYDNDRVNPSQNVDSYNTFDLRAFTRLNEGGEGVFSDLTLGMDIANIFDEDPPYVNIAPGVNGGGGYDPSAANPLGRIISVSLRKQF